MDFPISSTNIFFKPCVGGILKFIGTDVVEGNLQKFSRRFYASQRSSSEGKWGFEPPSPRGLTADFVWYETHANLYLP